MRIGVCTGVENIHKLEAMGFDYIEGGVNGTAALSEEQFANVKKIVDGSPIKCEAFNSFFPWDMKIVGPDAVKNTINEYIKRALERVALLGARVTVVGSGGPRKVPEGLRMEDGINQFADVLRQIGEEAAQYGIIAVIEPLNKGETNIINSVGEGLELVNRVNHDNVKLLADFYHMRLESEDMESILNAGDCIRHLHIANSKGRVYPKVQDEDEYKAFFKALKAIGYHDRISVEASTSNFDQDAPAALKLLRELSR